MTDPETPDQTAPADAAPPEAKTPATEAAAVPPVAPPAAGPKLELSDDLKRALEEAAALVGDQREQPAADFDPNQPAAAGAEPPPAGPSPKEMELKMQILELRQQLREKDKEIEQRLREVKQNLEQARHFQSQLEAYKYRVMKEKADWFNFGHEPVMKELLGVADSFERALQHAGRDPEPAALLGGVELILRQLLGVLAKFGVNPIETRGQAFNPEFHQAMSQVENDEVPANTVVEEFQRGYRLKDRLLRPAMVLVSRRRESAPAEAESAAVALTEDAAPEPEATVPEPAAGESVKNAGPDPEREP
jgi:molecular chaperone GrpE